MDSFFDTSYKKHLKSPEDFIVEEVINPKFTRKFKTRGGKVIRMSGDYALIILRKRNRTTESVIRELAGKFGIQNSSVGYAGLKDKFAVTSQYVTIKGIDKKELASLEIDGADIKFVQNIDKHISKGDLIQNNFRITLHGAGVRKVGKFKNFFGPQRFGNNLDNHMKGLEILKGKLSVQKERARFLVHSYQSYLFNRALADLQKLPEEITVIGFDYDKPKNKAEKYIFSLAELDGIKPWDFRVSKIWLSAGGFSRKTFVEPGNLRVSKGEKTVMEFSLPRASFASILLQEALR